jgi:hypothetical protein
LKEEAASTRFNDAVETCRAEFAKNRVDHYLKGLQSAVAVLRDAGEDISLEVRPRLDSTTYTGKNRIYANAAMKLDGRLVEWIIAAGDDKETTAMTCVSDRCEVARFISYRQQRTGEWTDYPKKEELQEAIFTAVYKVRAERHVLGEYDVPESPVTISKPFSVPAPLRLQKPGGDLN